MGEAQFSDVERILKSQGLTIKSLQVNVEEKMFRIAPQIFGAVNFFGQIQRVILWPFRGQFAFKNDGIATGAVLDLVYSAACGMAGAEVHHPTTSNIAPR
ncbi:hypothetical protein FDECE_18127 [Fusarium decemcellulare]|nr:hypothetical protein FDECE_18127 [Fusarium decemcellulare]